MLGDEDLWFTPYSSPRSDAEIHQKTGWLIAEQVAEMARKRFPSVESVVSVEPFTSPVEPFTSSVEPFTPPVESITPPVKAESPTPAVDSQKTLSRSKRSKKVKAAPSAPAPSVSTPSIPTPSVSTPSVSTPSVSTPYVPSPLAVLLSDPTFLALFYHHVTAAAHNALDQTGLWTYFQVEGITLVGGAVMTIYDCFTECLPPHIKQTSDIDLTWYLHTNPGAPNSQPHAVERLGESLVQQLQEQLSHPIVLEHIEYLFGDLVIPHLPTPVPSTALSSAVATASSSRCGFQITGKNLVVAYGSYRITIFFRGNLLADLTLHDGFGSQSFDSDHQPIPYSRQVPMVQDPMYSTEQRVIPVVDGIWPIRVPSLEVYVRQQLFAAGNLLLAGKEKGYRMMERVMYLIHAQCTPILIALLLEKLVMLQKWPGSAMRMERIKPMLRLIKGHLERYQHQDMTPIYSEVTAPHVPFPYSR